MMIVASNWPPYTPAEVPPMLADDLKSILEPLYVADPRVAPDGLSIRAASGARAQLGFRAADQWHYRRAAVEYDQGMYKHGDRREPLRLFR